MGKYQHKLLLAPRDDAKRTEASLLMRSLEGADAGLGVVVGGT